MTPTTDNLPHRMDPLDTLASEASPRIEAATTIAAPANNRTALMIKVFWVSLVLMVFLLSWVVSFSHKVFVCHDIRASGVPVVRTHRSRSVIMVCYDDVLKQLKEQRREKRVRLIPICRQAKWVFLIQLSVVALPEQGNNDTAQ
jgi:hypothetical protein